MIKTVSIRDIFAAFDEAQREKGIFREGCVDNTIRSFENGFYDDYGDDYDYYSESYGEES